MAFTSIIFLYLFSLLLFVSFDLILVLCKKNDIYKDFCHNKEIVAKKGIALTFDDGPHASLTPQLYDIFKEKNVHATFFVMGIKVVMHPDIVKRGIMEGHEIGNHVWDHPVLSKISIADVSNQLNRTSNAIYDAIEKIPSVMRPPYGKTNNQLNKYIANDYRMPVILWSLDTIDWKRPNSNDIVKRVLEYIQPGDILLCHDIHPNTIQAMSPLIDALLLKGYQFMTVSELLAYE